MPPHQRVGGGHWDPSQSRGGRRGGDSWDVDSSGGRGGSRGGSESNRLRERQEKQREHPKAKEMMAFRRKLPAFSQKEDLLQQVNDHRVLVVSGETGCGKTTQLPQFILEEEIAAGRGAECNIICTQPRRISAISVAQRVADERGEHLGQSVGYQIRLESKRSNDTRLLFCTTGVLLRRLVNEPELTGVSHVVVDEIHERGMNEDFLLIILRELTQRRPDLRLILMSATLNAELFSQYFGGAPMAHIPGYTFPVREHFLEDILENTGIVVRAQQSGGGGRKWYEGMRRGGGRGKDRNAGTFGAGEDDNEGYNHKHFLRYSQQTQSSLQTWYDGNDKLDLNLIEHVVEHICRCEGEGAVLVFLTGWDDITKLNDQLKSNRVTGDPSQVRVLPLHGSMPTSTQREIFNRPPRGVRKVVLATNIAETSITIDDIVYVVDCGKAKEKTYDAVNKLACLLPAWVSRASARQRRGRAGRVQDGVCYHLYTEHVHKEVFQEYQLPELLRTPLEELCLQIKSLKLGRIEAFLFKALQPPDALAVSNAIDLLEIIGALDKEEELTPLGEHLATLPVDPCIGKMIIMGATFGCLDPVLTIAAGMAYRDPFVMPMDKKEIADEVKRKFANGTCSDHIALLNAYDGWQRARNQGYGKEYCWRSFLSSNTLEMMEDMRRQFLDLLADMGFLGSDFSSRGGKPNTRSLKSALAGYSHHVEDLELLRAVLCAGMVPNVVMIQRKKNRVAYRTREDGKVDLHPSSVNAKEKYFPDNWLVYHDKVKSSGIFIRGSTNVSDYAMLLFGGTLEMTDHAASVSMLNGYISFSADRDAIALVAELRQELDHLLHSKIENPDMNLEEEGSAAVKAALALLHRESRYAPQAAPRGFGMSRDRDEAPSDFGRAGQGGPVPFGAGLRPGVAQLAPKGPLSGQQRGWRGRGNGPPK